VIFVDNYFESIDFTKIEILLLIGVFATLLPWILLPVEYNTTAIEKLEEKYNEVDAKDLIDNLTNYQKSEYDNTKTTIYASIDAAKRVQENKIGNATIAKQNAIKAINELFNNQKICEGCESLNREDFKVELDIEEEKLIEVKKEVLKEINELETTKVEIDLAIYKTLKSEEYQDRISIAFVIAMVTLVFSVYLSRKGYTSYTSWLEKLANDKLTFDLQLLQHVDKEKLKSFYHKTFQLDSEKREKLVPEKKRIPLEDVVNKDVLEWKPIDENVEWYSVFTEKLDYRFYEEFFGRIYSVWAKKNYFQETGVGGPDPGEYYPRLPSKTNMYTNPELSPWKNTKQIKTELLANDKKLYNQIFINWFPF